LATAKRKESDEGAPPTDAEIERGLSAIHPGGNRVERYRKSRSNNDALAQRQFAKDIAEIVKLRFSSRLSYEDIGKITGYSREKISKLCEPFKIIMEEPERIAAFKGNEASLLDGVRMLMVQGMVDQLSDKERRETLDLSRLTYGYGVLFDKARLERGESTANVKLSLAELVQQAHAQDITDLQEAEIVEDKTPKSSDS
jgi:hypothetical protein